MSLMAISVAPLVMASCSGVTPSLLPNVSVSGCCSLSRSINVLAISVLPWRIAQFRGVS